MNESTQGARRALILAVSIFLLSILIAVISQLAFASDPTRKELPLYREGEIIVKMKRAPAEEGLGVGANFLTAYDLMWSLSQRYALTARPLQMDSDLVKLKIENDIPVETVLRDLRRHPMVEYAEPNFIYSIGLDYEDQKRIAERRPVVPNDPSLQLDWGLVNSGQRDAKGQVGIPGVDIGAQRAWAYAKGSKRIVVAVIDTGVDYLHEDLSDNIFTNVYEIPGNGKDDDGNGFIDDVHGWNFADGNNDPMDDHSHGTHCSGTISAKGDNKLGTSGVAWYTSILPLKFLTSSGSGTLEHALEAIKYATSMRVNIMSNSWGGGGYSETLFEAIKQARDAGILFVAAAGNDSNDNDARESYPASYNVDNVISVAATDNRDKLANWSNYGKKKVHLSAPGVNIFSTVPKLEKGSTGYGVMSGTSMATPHVSGAAAVVWSTNPRQSYQEVRQKLLATVAPVKALKNKTITGGRLHLYNALTGTVPPRNEPNPRSWKSANRLVESEHPYKNDSEFSSEISHPGAKFLRIHFSKVDVERGYDVISLQDKTGEILEQISGKREDYWTDYVDGDRIRIYFKADTMIDGWGFVIDKYEYIE